MTSLSIANELLGALIALEQGMVSSEDVQEALTVWSSRPEQDLLDCLADVGRLSIDELATLGEHVQEIAPTLRDASLSEHFELRGFPTGPIPGSTVDALDRAEGGSPHNPDGFGLLDPDTLLLGTPSGREWVYSPGASGPRQRFQEVRKHDGGGLGIISVAIDAELNREVALKKIRPEAAHEPSLRSRFLLEAEVTGQLEHPAIVPVYSLGYDASGDPYYAMRLIRGDTLLVAIQRHHDELQGLVDKDRDGPQPLIPPSTLRQLVSRFVTVCQAVEYAHSRGVIHRDIKPSNILLGPYGETLLVDWGMAKVLRDHSSVLIPCEEATGAAPSLEPAASGEHTQAGTVVGTPGFMSPEQALSANDQVSFTSDVYSLGATLHTLIAGQTPFAGDTPDEIRNNAIEANFQPRRPERTTLDGALESIALKAMARQPIDRYTSAHALADDLNRWLDGEPVLAHRESLSRRCSRWLNTHRLLMTSLAAAGLVGLIALGVFSVVQTIHNNALVAAAKERSESELRARSHVDFVLSLVARSISRAGASDSFSDPQPVGYRRYQLEDARDFYDRLLPRMADDPDPQSQLTFARASADLSRVISLLQSKQDALPPMELAVRIYRARVAAMPSDADTVQALVFALYDQSVIELDLGQLTAARCSADSALVHLSSLAHHQNNPNLEKTQRARLLAQLATIAAHSGHLVESASGQAHAASLTREVLTSMPESRELRGMLAGNLAGEAHSRLALGEIDRAAPLYTESLGLRAGLYQENPASIDACRELASIHHKLGILERQRKYSVEAISHWNKALQLERKIVDFDAWLIDDQCRMARTLCSLAEVHRWRGDVDVARPLWAEARQILEPILEANPALESPRITLSKLLQEVSEQAVIDGDLSAAQSLIDNAIGVIRLLNESAPEAEQGWGILAICLVTRARLNNRLNEFTQGEQDAREALEILKSRAHPDEGETKVNPLAVRAAIELAAAALHTGQYGEALTSLQFAENLVAKPAYRSSRESLRMAEIFTRLHDCISPADALDLKVTHDLRERAVAQLEAVHAERGIDPQWLDTSRAFDSLRSHSRFIKLRRQLDYPTETPTR